MEESSALQSKQEPARPEQARVGVTASRKIGGAVVRNRAKRLVREAFRHTPELWPSDIDLVVIVRRPPEKMKLCDVISEWTGASSSIRRRIREARSDHTARSSGLAERL
jgi:ribonuclease P protein component